MYKLSIEEFDDLRMGIRSEELKPVYEAIEKGLDVNMRGRNKDTLLFTACEVNNLELVKFLCKKGANPNLADKMGQVALFKALSHENEEMVDILIEAGADVNYRDTMNGTMPGEYAFIPLQWPVESCNLNLVTKLVKAGAIVTDVLLEFDTSEEVSKYLKEVKKSNDEIIAHAKASRQKQDEDNDDNDQYRYEDEDEEDEDQEEKNDEDKDFFEGEYEKASKDDDEDENTR